ncbi:MAG: DUF2971 domain-containing protein [Sneathiella sp.]|nr:DUF2971 domain-containing protein [Sneathiella sp.]
MDDNAQKLIVDKLWGDFDETSDFPAKRPLLAHYTSIDTFEKIVSNDELWLSNPLFMNDLEELRFGMNQGSKHFNSSSALSDAFQDKSRYHYLVECFNKFFSNYEVNHVFDTYLTCFSEHDVSDYDGRLSMWRGYGNSGNGVALVIDTSKINYAKGSPLIIAKVNYASTDSRVQWINEKILEVANIARNIKHNDGNLKALAHYWFERLKIFALCTKHSGFSEEQEWRLVYMSERDETGILKDKLSYAISANGVEPKLKLKIEHIPGIISENVSLSDLTERIILGPSISSILAEKSVVRILEILGQNQLCKLVSPSGIPFRP